MYAGARGARAGIGCPGMGVEDDCKLPRGCWELSPDLLNGQSVLLTSELSIQPLGLLIFSAKMLRKHTGDTSLFNI